MERRIYALDVRCNVNEDDSRSNVLHAAANIGTLRWAVLNIVKSYPALKKLGMAKVRRRAKWNGDGAMIKQVFGAL